MSSRFVRIIGGAVVVAFLLASSFVVHVFEEENFGLKVRLVAVTDSRNKLLSTLDEVQGDRLGDVLPDADAVPPTAEETAATNESVSLQPRSFAGSYNCQEEGQFSGAWFASVDFFLSLHLVPANVEGATFSVIMAGKCIRTLDFLDFWVEHLSVYEQLVQVVSAPDETKSLFALSVEQNLERHVRELNRAVSATIPRPPKILSQVVALIPFYGGMIGGASHSLRNTRLAYLDATIKSVRQIFPFVVVGVLSKEDHEIVRGRGLPLFDVLEVFNLPQNDNLATATLVAAQEALRSNPKWISHHFSRVYFTEGDQVLRIRSLASVLDLVQGDQVLAPHRTMAVATPPDFTHDLLTSLNDHPPSKKFLAETGAKDTNVLGVNIENDGSCCLVGINPHPPSMHNFWFNERSFIDYPVLWRQLGSFAMQPGEQGHDRHGWTCDLQQERASSCHNPYI